MENPSGNIACLSWALAHQQGLNAAVAGHIWMFSPVHGFDYHQFASPQALERQWAAPIIGHAAI